MGLFNKAKKAAADKARDVVAGAVDKIPGAKKEAESMPDELRIHQKEECAKVAFTIYHQENLSKLKGDTVEIEITKCKPGPNFSLPYMVSAGGVLLGGLSQEMVDLRCLQVPGKRIAEISRPVYANQEYIELYIPLTEDELKKKQEKEDEKEALKLWFNVTGDKWEGPEGEHQEYGTAKILEQPEEGKKSSYIITGDGIRLCTITSRMKSYADIEARYGKKISHLTAKQYEGDYGKYWRVGLFY